MSEKPDQPLDDKQLEQVAGGEDGGFRRLPEEITEINRDKALEDLLSDQDLAQVSGGAEGGFNRSIRPGIPDSTSQPSGILDPEPTNPNPEPETL
ncbi:MAG: hypothetical protein Kow00121_32690 [Elainellaceae cyanobacterium]